MIGEPRDEPYASRLRMPGGYQQAADDDSLLPWSQAVEMLEVAKNYWLATTWPDGRPHVTPLWGVWVDGALYFDGIPTARWARNMAANPAITIHLESGNDVVILDGLGEDIEAVTDEGLAGRIVGAWEVKYGGLLPEPATRGLFRLRPLQARAWTRFPHDATRWEFLTTDG